MTNRNGQLPIDRSDCTGCAACASVCPQGAITMSPDHEGFIYPTVDADNCTGCLLCRDICPIYTAQKQRIDRPQPAVFAGWHKDSLVRHNSSSGGAFSALADYVICQGGVVVGAAFTDKLEVRHVVVRTHKDLEVLRGSKYVQSFVDPDIYKTLQGLLRDGFPVLFSGTPCQVAAARASLPIDSSNLYCVDLVCLGVPSPKLWREYIWWLSRRFQPIRRVSFRDKSQGWNSSCVRIELFYGSRKIIPFAADAYMLTFLRNLSLRPSCYGCKFANLRRQGDITLGDFWGVKNRYPQYDQDDRGTSLILVNTEVGSRLLDACASRLFLGQADIETAVAGNPMLVRPAGRPMERNSFYLDLQGMPFEGLIHRYKLKPPGLAIRLIRKFRRGISRIRRVVGMVV